MKGDAQKGLTRNEIALQRTFLDVVLAMTEEALIEFARSSGLREKHSAQMEGFDLDAEKFAADRLAQFRRWRREAGGGSSAVEG